MPRTALGEGAGLTRTHSDRPKTTHHPQKSGLADFQVENLQAYELSGLAPVFACGEATKPGLAPNGSLNQQSQLKVKGKMDSKYLPQLHAIYFETLDNFAVSLAARRSIKATAASMCFEFISSPSLMTA